MIIDELHQLSTGVTVRHEQSCNGAVTITLTSALGGTSAHGAMPTGNISARCTKCGAVLVSHIVKYSADADLLNIADRVEALTEQLPITEERAEAQQIVQRLRDRGNMT